MAIVYRHRRLDTNEIFYIGVGVDKTRANQRSTKKRSNYWHNVANKTQISIEIIAEDIDYVDALELESFLISLYGRKNIGLGNLVNLTDGGDGCTGIIISEKHKEVLRKRMNSCDNPAKNMTQVHRDSIKKSNKNKWKGKIHSEETKEKISKSRKGIMTYGEHHQAKSVINTETGEIYSTIKEVAELLKIKYTTLRAKLYGQSTNNTSYKMLEEGGSY